jgi:hypothetical protein
MSGQGASEKIREFCNVEKFSIAFFYELERRGLGPLMLDVPGTLLSRLLSRRQPWQLSRSRQSDVTRRSAASRTQRAHISLAAAFRESVRRSTVTTWSRWMIGPPE